ncbi:MAG: hypothetical protein R3B45_16160 [Bdellovibrionota bacterium]
MGNLNSLKKGFATGVLALSTSVFATSTDDVVYQSQNISRILAKRADSLSYRTLSEIEDHLNKIQRLIRLDDGDQGGRGGRHGYACNDENSDIYQDTFKQIKNFAYSSSGLNYSSQGATDFALQWTSEHACYEADEYIEQVGELRVFAYSSNGMNFSSAGAVDFALENYDQKCSQGLEYQYDYRDDYRFAYSSSGLNMSSSGAHKYALDRMMAEHFSCNGSGHSRIGNGSGSRGPNGGVVVRPNTNGGVISRRN